MSKLKQANITVVPAIWEEFKSITKQNNSDASKEIRKFMRKYLSAHPDNATQEK